MLSKSQLISSSPSRFIRNAVCGTGLAMCLACSGCPDSSNSSSGIPGFASVQIANVSAEPSITGSFANATTVTSINAIAYGARSCTASLAVNGSTLGDLTVKASPSGTVRVTDITNISVDNYSPKLFYLVYGPTATMKDLLVDLNGGAGNFQDIWVTDVSTLNTKNYQVIITDNTAKTQNQVSPVAGVDTQRMQLEGTLQLGHSYTVTLLDGGTVFKSVDFTTDATKATQVVVTLCDKPGTTTQELKAFLLTDGITGGACTN